MQTKEEIAARKRAKLLEKNPDAKERVIGTPAERVEFYYDPFETIPVDLENLTPRELGLRYGVSKQGISRIINRKTYREIP